MREASAARNALAVAAALHCIEPGDIWMELHEDLIVMLRIDRVAEGSF